MLIMENNLNQSQQAFCAEPSNAIRLLAPAGSGKTYSLLWRCLRITQASKNNSTPVRFLIVTFTKAARDELRDRIKLNTVFKPLRGIVEVVTLNSWGYRWLNPHLYNPRLIANSKSRSFCMTNTLQPIWKKHDKIKKAFEDASLKFKAPKSLIDLMDKLKSMGFRHDTHTSDSEFYNHVKWLIDNGMIVEVNYMLNVLTELKIIDPNIDKETAISQAFTHYFEFWRESCSHLYSTSTLTLEDQKYWSFIELEKEVKENKYSVENTRYHHILVDEFQDVNTLDINLLKAIAQSNKTEICIVGDDDQAIYEWRGATPEFILNPNKYLGCDYKTFILETNYRSPKNIVEHSQQLIKHNQRRVDKKVNAYSDNEAVIEVISSPSLETSIEYVLQTVHKLLKDKSINNIALISRKRSQLIPYQIIFAGEEIPFYAAEDLQVLLSNAFNELKLILMLKVQCNQIKPLGPDPVEALLMLCNQVKTVPLKRVEAGKLNSHILAKKPKTLVDALDAMYSYAGPLKGKNIGGAMTKKFYKAIVEFIKAKTVADAIRAISHNFEGLKKNYGKSIDDIFYADPPFLYLSSYAERYGDDYVAFYDDIEKVIKTIVKTSPGDNTDESWNRPLHLMTALRTKGKEFDVVIILDANEGIWPSKLALTPKELESERRLFYVATTRTKQKLILLINENMFGEPVFPTPYITEMGLADNIEAIFA